MHLFVFILIHGVAMVTYGAHNPPKGLYFVGVGYNLLKGNPEGGDLSLGGVDPGLLLTRKIFQLTWKTKKLSTDKKYNVPDQVSFAPRDSCVMENKTSAVFGCKSYQEELKVEVGAEAGYDNGLWGFSFSLSSRYKEMQKETSEYHNVFYEEKKVCNRGRVRFQYDLALQKNYPVTKEFASAVCSLPAKYNERKYLKFIEEWGTHVVLEAELGEKTTTRYKSSRTEVVNYAMQNIGNSVSVGGSYGAFSASLSVDVETFKESMSQKTKFGSNKKVFKSGGPDLPEPIKVKLEWIYDVFRVRFFRKQQQQMSRCDFSDSFFRKLKKNTKKLFGRYPKLANAALYKDPNVSIPLLWPEGTYGIPMPKSGCPSVKVSGFPWHEGTRYQDTEDSGSNNQWSRPYDLAGRAERNDMEQKFCMKTEQGSTKFSLPWPKGKYCIFKKGKCPKGLNEGWLLWDDEDSNTRNNYKGALPDGTYNKDTKIYFCCRTDGFPTNAIYLPTNSNFVLLRYGGLCQYVRGMRVTDEYFKWDTSDWKNRDRSSGTVPDTKDIGKDIKLHYCYYSK